MRVGYLVVIRRHESDEFQRRTIHKKGRDYEYSMEVDITDGIRVFLSEELALDFLKSILPVKGGIPRIFKVLIPDSDAENFV